jgi:hypothetical protein
MASLDMFFELDASLFAKTPVKSSQLKTTELEMNRMSRQRSVSCESDASSLSYDCYKEPLSGVSHEYTPGISIIANYNHQDQLDPKKYHPSLKR